MEIDVTKCDYYFQGRCSVSSNINYSLGCNDNDCYYKQLQQLKAENEGLQSLNDFNVQKIETLEAENEELRKSNTSNAKAFLKENKEKHKLLDCLDEIEELCKINPIDTCWTALNLCDKCKEKEECGLQSPFARLNAIKNIIKQAKEGE